MMSASRGFWPPSTHWLSGSTSRRIARPGYGAVHAVSHDFNDLLSKQPFRSVPVTPMGFWLPSRVSPHSGWSPSPVSSPLDVAGSAASCFARPPSGACPPCESVAADLAVGARALPGISAPPGSRLEPTTLTRDPSSALVEPTFTMRLTPH